MAKDLQHESIIKYKYFLKKHSKSLKTSEFHILMEAIDGQDLSQFLKKIDIRKVLDVSGRKKLVK